MFYQFDVNNQDQENILTKDGPKQKKCHAKWIKTGQDQKDIDAVKLTDGSEERIWSSWSISTNNRKNWFVNWINWVFPQLEYSAGQH